MTSVHFTSPSGYVRELNSQPLSIFYNVFPCVSPSIEDAIPDEIRELVCCGLCGCPTPWNDGSEFSCANEWRLIRKARLLDLFSAPLTGAEFYDRIANLIYRSDFIGIWCPDCASSRISSAHP